MVYRFILLLVLLRTQIQAAECPLVTGAELGSLSTQSSSGLIAGWLTEEGAMTPVAVHLVEYNVVCLSSGRSEDRYRFASVVVNYSCAGNDLCPPNNNSVLSQIHCECAEAPGEGEGWVLGTFGDNVYAVQTPPDAALSTELRTECAACVHPEQTLSGEYAGLGFDNETHCAFCDQQCQQSGLGLCFGPTANDCFGTEPQGGNGFSVVWAIVILAILGSLVLALVCILLIFWGVNCRLYKSRGNYPAASASLEDVSIELKHIKRRPSLTTDNQQDSFNVPGPNDAIDLSHLLRSPEIPLPSPNSLGISPYTQNPRTTHLYAPQVQVYPSPQHTGFSSSNGQTNTDQSLCMSDNNSAASPDIDVPTPCSQDQASMAGQYTGTPL